MVRTSVFFAVPFEYVSWPGCVSIIPKYLLQWPCVKQGAGGDCSAETRVNIPDLENQGKLEQESGKSGIEKSGFKIFILRSVVESCNLTDLV